MNKILIIGPAWVGDMVMAQCLFKLLKMRHKEICIEVLAPAWSSALLNRMPEVNSSFTMPMGHGEIKLSQRYSLAKTLREKNYTQAIVLPNSFKSALIPFFAKIPKRTGWLGEMRFGLLNDIRYLNKSKYPLMIERFMALGVDLNADLPNEYPIPQLEVTELNCRQAILKHDLNLTKPVLAICPGAEFGPAKRWPEKYFIDVANEKLINGWDVWIFGSNNDKPIAENIMLGTKNGCKNLCGKTNLEEAIDLLSLTSGVISNDSGLMHIAASLNKPLIVVYGPTSAGFTPPLHSKAKILTTKLPCQPCFKRTCPLNHHDCMETLSSTKVLQAMQEWVV